MHIGKKERKIFKQEHLETHTISSPLTGADGSNGTIIVYSMLILYV